MANVWFIGIACARAHTHIVSFELITSPVTLLLQDKELSFKLELIGATWLMLYIYYELLLELDLRPHKAGNLIQIKKKLSKNQIKNFTKIDPMRKPVISGSGLQGEEGRKFNEKI